MTGSSPAPKATMPRYTFTPTDGPASAAVPSSRRRWARWAAMTILGSVREPIAGTIVQTLPGTHRHLPAEFQQLRNVDRFWELVRFCSCLRLTIQGSLVRSQLRPPSSDAYSAPPIDP